MLSESPFYQFVREERFFCSILAHLLMQKGPNLRLFLDLVAERMGERPTVEDVNIQDAEIYLEFSYLRDHWDTLGRDNERRRANERKRTLIMTLLSKVPELHQYGIPELPEAIADFNAFFMGSRGLRIRQDISSPGQWSVATLSERFGKEPEQFRGFCKFKWSFNIKPDIVVRVPGSKPLSIEAKLESKEGQYPANGGERKIFDELFGVRQGRVGQIELQQFMFSVLLDDPCDSLFLARDPGPGVHMTWQDVFQRLDLDASIEFVRRLIRGNSYLKPKRATPFRGQS